MERKNVLLGPSGVMSPTLQVLVWMCGAILGAKPSGVGLRRP